MAKRYEPTRGDTRTAWFAEVHGRARYRKGCRCDTCRAAETAYRAAYRAARRRQVGVTDGRGRTPTVT